MKIKRRDRLINISTFLLEHPNHPVTLKSFIQRYHCAKSSLSKDVAIIRHNFAERGMGIVHTQVGAIGGIVYKPVVSRQKARTIIKLLIKILNGRDRYLPGGYVYMTDLLSQPYALEQIGKVVATRYFHHPIDTILTVSGRGIIAISVARSLGVPFVAAHHRSRISDGATINVNYFSAYSHQFHNLVLPQRSLKSDSHVLIVDDYLKGGSTINGMLRLIKAFHCHLSGITILADGSNGRPHFRAPYNSLIRFTSRNGQIMAQSGNIF